MLEYVILLFQKQYGTNLPLKDGRRLLICLTKLSDTMNNMNNQIYGPDKLHPVSRALTTGTWCPGSYINLTEHAGEKNFIYIWTKYRVVRKSAPIYLSISGFIC